MASTSRLQGSVNLAVKGLSEVTQDGCGGLEVDVSQGYSQVTDYEKSLQAQIGQNGLELYVYE